MVNSQFQVEKEISADISWSFWPFPPKKILAIGDDTVSLGLHVAEALPLTHVTLVISESLQKDDLHFNSFIERISVISGFREQVDCGSSYPIILAVNQLLPLGFREQFDFLSFAWNRLKIDGRVLALEMISNANRSSLPPTMERLGRAVGFHDVTISPMDDTSWSAILFRRQRDF